MNGCCLTLFNADMDGLLNSSFQIVKVVARLDVKRSKNDNPVAVEVYNNNNKKQKLHFNNNTNHITCNMSCTTSKKVQFSY